MNEADFKRYKLYLMKILNIKHSIMAHLGIQPRIVELLRKIRLVRPLLTWVEIINKFRLNQVLEK